MYTQQQPKKSVKQRKAEAIAQAKKAMAPDKAMVNATLKAASEATAASVPSTGWTNEELKKLKKPELLDRCQKLNIKGISKLKKPELIAKLLDNGQQN